MSCVGYKCFLIIQSSGHFSGFTLTSFSTNMGCSVQFSRSVVSDSATPWIAARQASLSITNSRSSLRLTSIESVMPSSHLILGRPFLLLPPIPPSIRVFSNESTLHMRWPKYWSFTFSIIPSRNPRADLLQKVLSKCQFPWAPLPSFSLTWLFLRFHTSCSVSCFPVWAISVCFFHSPFPSPRLVVGLCPLLWHSSSGISRLVSSTIRPLIW